ncbi:uncharacterized protein LOC144363997 [Saccoglossus kowalevskii]
MLLGSRERMSESPVQGSVEAGPRQRAMVRDLTSLLRQNGHRILHGNGKLSLTTNSLCYFNDCFSLLTDGNTDASWDTKFNQNLTYLYEFMKKSPALKVMHGNTTLLGTINISHFQRLHTLEISVCRYIYSLFDDK